jgi:MFS transporter, DHA2 family, multidrug resistance protein
VINTVLTDQNYFHYQRLAEHVHWGSPEARNMLANMSRNFQSHGMDGDITAMAKISAMVRQQAWTLSFMDVFYLLTVLFASLAVFALLMRKPPAAAGGGGGH